VSPTLFFIFTILLDPNAVVVKARGKVVGWIAAEDATRVKEKLDASEELIASAPRRASNPGSRGIIISKVG